MKKITLTLTIILLVSAALNAVFDDYEPSPRARALGGAYTAISDDAGAVFYNPAGLLFAQNNVKINYTNRYGLDFSVLSTAAASYQLPKSWGTIGLGLMTHDVEYLDVNLMSEQYYSLSHAFQLVKDIHSQLVVGYSFTMMHLEIDGYGDQPAFGFNLGAMAVLHQRTRLGFTVSNINNPKVGEDDRHELPQRMAIAIAYEPYDGVTTALELKKSVEDDEVEIHSGVEVKVFDILDLRFGARSYPASYSAGFGLELYNVQLDYGLNTHSVLDPTHHFGLGYRF